MGFFVFVFDQFPKNTGACLGFAADALLRGFINIQSIFVFLLFISQSFFFSSRTYYSSPLLVACKIMSPAHTNPIKCRE